MWSDFVGEFRKFSAQRKSWLLTGGTLFLCLIVVLCLHLAKLPQDLNENKQTLNLFAVLDGLTYARIVMLPLFWILLPIFVCTLAGDCVAGELHEGCLKLYAARPRSRFRILFTRFAALLCYTALLTIALFLAITLFGTAIYGLPGVQFSLSTMSTEVGVFALPDALLRIAGQLAFALFWMAALGGMTLFFSCIFERMTVATIAGLITYFLCFVLDKLPLLNLDSLRPYLLPTILVRGCDYLWMEQIPWHQVTVNSAYALAYLVLFYGLAQIIFSHRDLA